MERRYITKEVPILGVLVEIMMGLIACFFLYILIFKSMIPDIKEKWPTLTPKERIGLIGKDILIIIGIIAGGALLVFLLMNFKIDFSR